MGFSWISLVVAAITGGVVGLLASLLVPGTRDEQNKGAVAAIVLIAVLAAHFLLSPRLESMYAMRTIDKTLSQNPAFSAIKTYDNAAYTSLMADIKAAMEKGKTQNQISAMVRTHIGAVVQKRLPQASNDSAVAYMQVMLQEMKEMKAQDGNVCFQFLFPQEGSFVDPTKFISAETRKADLEALGQVIKHASLMPQPLPREAEVMLLITPIVNDLGTKYGAGMRDLQNPNAPGVNKARLCGMLIDMYSQILQLPGEQNGKVVRFMLGQAAK